MEQHAMRCAFSILVFPLFLWSTTVLAQWNLPSGFKFEEYATVPNARQMALGEKGTLFVGTRSDGRVFAVQDFDNDFKADKTITLARDLDMPSGVAVDSQNSLYIAAVNQVFVIKHVEKAVKDMNWRLSLVTNRLPDHSHHGWKNIAFGPDGRLFIPVGVPCNVCLSSNPHIGTILAMDVKSETIEVVAKGVRNSVGFDWHPNDGALWFSDNGRDWMGDDLPPDEINRLSYAGEHFGFPFYHASGVPEPEARIYTKLPSEFDYTRPQVDVPAHSAPLGIHFYQGSQFPAKYRTALFVAEHGSWNRSEPIGYQVVAYWFDKLNKVKEKQVLIGGFLTENGDVKGRPVAFQPLHDGSLLVSDDHAGKVYRLSYSTTEN